MQLPEGAQTRAQPVEQRLGVPARARGQRLPWHRTLEPRYAIDVWSGPASCVCSDFAARLPACRFAPAAGIQGQDHGVCRSRPWGVHTQCSSISNHVARPPRARGDDVQDKFCCNTTGVSPPEGLPTVSQPRLSSARQCGPRRSRCGGQRCNGAGGGPLAAPCCRRLCSGAGRCTRLGCRDECTHMRVLERRARPRARC